VESRPIFFKEFDEGLSEPDQCCRISQTYLISLSFERWIDLTILQIRNWQVTN